MWFEVVGPCPAADDLGHGLVGERQARYEMTAKTMESIDSNIFLW